MKIFIDKKEEIDNWLEKPIESLNLSRSSYNRLKEFKINKMKELAVFISSGGYALLAIRNLGVKGLEEIKEMFFRSLLYQTHLRPHIFKSRFDKLWKKSSGFIEAELSKDPELSKAIKDMLKASGGVEKGVLLENLLIRDRENFRWSNMIDFRTIWESPKDELDELAKWFWIRLDQKRGEWIMQNFFNPEI